MPLNDALITQIYLEVGGSPLSPAVMAVFVSAEVDRSLHMPGMATLILIDEKLELVDGPTFDIGKVLRVGMRANPRFGERDTAITTIFTGVIAAIEPEYPEGGGYRFAVRAYEKTQFLNRGSSTATYENVTDNDLVKKVAGAAGLSVQAAATKIVRKHVYRDDMSDYEFLSILARRNGFVLVMDGETLLFKAPDALGFPDVPLDYGTTLRDFRPRLAVASQVNGVEVRGWDAIQKQAVSGVANTATFAPNALGIASRGSAIAQSKIAGSKLLLAETPEEPSQAEGAANAALSRLSAGDIVGDGQALGEPKLQPGCKVKITGLGTKFSGTYFVTRTRHVFDTKGVYSTDFWVGGMTSGTVSSLISDDVRSTAPGTPAMTGLMIGIVTDNKDPDDRYRVRVKFPSISDADASWWAPVMSLGAGDQRGLSLLPEINDQVIVGFASGDINRPFVLGGLWNAKDAPPTKQGEVAPNGNVEIRELKSRVGHVIRLTDTSGKEKIEIIDKTKGNSIVIESSGGGKIVIACDGPVTVTSKQTATIEATQNVVVKATSNVEVKGLNVSVEAQAKLALKGAIVDISGSGPVKISGAVVQIN